MKFAIIGKATRNTDFTQVRELLQFLTEQHIQYALYPEYATELALEPSFQDTDGIQLLQPQLTDSAQLADFDILYSLGGDGTMLGAAALACALDIPILGVNMGRLGFLTGTQQCDMVAVTQEIILNRFKLEERHLLQIDTDPIGILGHPHYALNEVTIHKSNSNEMIVVHVYINGEFLNSYWADGVIISTPTGSTAYNLACGGPIISPACASNVITPIAPHSLTVRPILIPHTDIISVELESRSGQALIAMDQRTHVVQDHVQLAIRKAPFPAKLVKVNPPSYFATLRSRLNWGLDNRN
ncbi:MAG: NAD kinase [Bacteroidetes bacterium]|nr:NAD kinase [Bacteroidota bacterium]